MKILLTGDFFYNYNYIADDYKDIISEIKNYDKVFINYEGSFIGSEKIKKSISLSMTDNSLNLPNNTSLILCNNHITDFGPIGIKKTIDKIKSKKIDFFGLNKNIQDTSYFKNYQIKKKNIFIASLGWTNEECIPAKKNTPGIKPFNSKSIFELKEIIDKDKKKFSILYIHAGYEWEKYPLPEHVGLAREAVDSGFDLVYFCHSHTIQEYEFYKNKLIHYGLGNFYFSSMRENFPSISDYGKCLVLELKSNKIKYYYREVFYNRKKKESKLKTEKLLNKKNLLHADLYTYSKNYKNFRFRKKNPRPILYYKKKYTNYIKFKSWKLIVDILGFLNLRPLVKSLLGWK
jgi:poly-gamma-glutamate capsule biosynthesis protein CapA/YwtB (metallophosphatase superfamily)